MDARGDHSGAGRVAGTGNEPPGFIRAIDRLLPAELRADPDSELRARILMAFALSIVPIGGAFALYFGLVGSASLALVNLFPPIFIGLVVPLLRGTGSIALATNYAACVLVIGLTADVVLLGVHAPMVMWFAGLPYITMLLIGTRAGLSWVAGLSLLVGGLFLLDARGVLPEPAFPPNPVMDYVVLVGFLVVLASFGVMHTLVKGRAFTALEAINRRLVDAQLRAEEASRAKSDFLAAVSHEIRTPMNGVLGMTDLLLDSGLRDDQREYAEVVRTSGSALLDIIEDILDLSSIESQNVVLRPTEFSPQQMVRDVAKLLDPLAHEKRLELAAEVDEDVPAAVVGDAGRIRQVLLNLAGNAVKFTEEGGVRIALDVTEDQAGRPTLRFQVTDTGIGIPAEQVERLFEPFHRVDSSSARRSGGTGLGLAISRRLADALGGSITVAPGPESGTRFTLLVPVAQTSAAAGGQALSAPEPLSGTGKVLVVDDNPVNRMVAARMVRRCGYTCEEASGGRAAIEAVTRGAFDAVLMDCQMPDVDGCDATRAIRSREGEGEHTPIVALTASAGAEDRERCLSAGMDEHLVKPVTLEKLSQVLAQLTDKTAQGTSQTKGSSEPQPVSDQPPGARHR
jgi:signal transduction histidine kinase/CheY-like chemotaxis protein